MGGTGAAVLETLADAGIRSDVVRLGVPDCFVTHGSVPVLLEGIGLTATGVRDAVLRGLGKVRDLASGPAADAVAGAAAARIPGPGEVHGADTKSAGGRRAR
jgi:hypothetical protein